VASLFAEHAILITKPFNAAGQLITLRASARERERELCVVRAVKQTGRFHYDYYGVRVPCPNIAPVAFESAGCERGLLGSNIYRAQSVGSIYVSPVHINNKTAQHATATSECKLRCHGKVHFDCDVNGVELFNVCLSMCFSLSVHILYLRAKPHRGLRSEQLASFSAEKNSLVLIYGWL
jgi:hypothetical protein